MRYFNLYVTGTNDLFTYLDQNDEYEVGMFVQVKFRGKDSVAIIIEESKEKNFTYKVNSILRKYPSELQYDSNYIELLKWVKNYYISGYSQIFNIGMNKREKVVIKKYYRIIKDSEFISELEKKLYKYLGKKEKIGAVHIEKRFTKDELENFILSGKLIIENEETKKEYEVCEGVEYKSSREDIDLNPEQEEIRKSIEEDERKYFLIRGITGSGKTEIYISLIKSALKEGKGAIFLVPEISLTPQMIERFLRAFGDTVAILHSRMTPNEITEEWVAVNNGNKRVILGVRSAIFAPIKNLGYIIIDEEHENTYKQDTSPRYHARTVALKRADIEGCKLVLGSATPSVESYYYAKKNVFKLLTLDKRYNDATMPKIEIVDMKKEENPYFSKLLLENIKKRLLKNEQVILLLNRKGYSTYVQCKTCGHVEECQHCSVKYSYYMRDNVLKCSYCGVAKKYNGKCSKCGSDKILQSGVGVERIEESLQEIFAVPIVRVDSEISKTKNFHENLYRDFLEGKYKIMIGTQMITKGLHFPNVTLVGVINGDTTLSFPDFRSGEKTFQLLTQVAGRSGRGDKAGEVIVQTYQPENKIFEDVLSSDYEDFYNREIEDRRIFNYPPFTKIINIGISAIREEGLMEFAKSFAMKVDATETDLYGPMRSLVYKVKDRYRVNILVKGERVKVEKVKKQLKVLLKEYEKEKKFRITVDIDPMNLI